MGHDWWPMDFYGPSMGHGPWAISAPLTTTSEALDYESAGGKESRQFIYDLVVLAARKLFST